MSVRAIIRLHITERHGSMSIDQWTGSDILLGIAESEFGFWRTLKGVLFSEQTWQNFLFEFVFSLFNSYHYFLMDFREVVTFSMKMWSYFINFIFTFVSIMVLSVTVFIISIVHRRCPISYWTEAIQTDAWLIVSAKKIVKCSPLEISIHVFTTHFLSFAVIAGCFSSTVVRIVCTIPAFYEETPWSKRLWESTDYYPVPFSRCIVRFRPKRLMALMVTCYCTSP